MGIPHGKRETGNARMLLAIRVDIATVEDDLDRAPAHLAAAQPHQGAQSSGELREVQQLSRRQRVEVTCEQVASVLMLGDRPQQRAQLERPAAFCPGRVHRAEMHAEYAYFAAGKLDLEKRMAGDSWLVPIK